MNKPTLFKTAVILFALMNIFSIITSLLGILNPALTEGIPPFVIVLSTILGATGLVSAWGAWQGQKWGIWLTISLSVVGGLSALPGVLLGPNNFARTSAIIGVVIQIFAIVVFLRYRPTVTHF
ncbi:MAG: hypothetical protein GY805_09825 [Chloroflexi bacterium]|nr:hypothetical protein [Chloroflexota bacterium]